MLSASQLSFIVLLAAFQCQTQARRVMKEFDNGVEGRRNVTKCGWNCKVIESDLPQELKKRLCREQIHLSFCDIRDESGPKSLRQQNIR